MRLPNLSMLSIGMPRRGWSSRSEDEDSDDDDFAPAKKAKKEEDYPWTPINDVSFSNMVARLKSFSKALYRLSFTTDPDSDAFRYEFKFEYFPLSDVNFMKLRMKAIYGVTPCVEITINFVAEAVIVKDLFYEANKTEREGKKVLCDMTPQRNAKAGAGDQLLSIATLIASQLGYSVSLYDAATFTPAKKPANAINNFISVHQGLTRGYGYYQARGFVNQDNLDAAEKEIGTVDVYDFEEVMQFELDFIHLAVNTELDELYDIMRRGHTILKIPAFLRGIYNEAFFRRVSVDSSHELREKMENLDYHAEKNTSMLTPELEALMPFEELSLRQVHQHYEAIQDFYMKAYGVDIDVLFMLETAFEEIRKTCFPDPVLETDESCYPLNNMLAKKTFRDEATGKWFEVVPQIDPQSGDFKRPITVRRPIADGFFVKVR